MYSKNFSNRQITSDSFVTKGRYKGLSRREIEESIREEGFFPTIIHNTPGYIYSTHQHPETKLLAILDGDMKVIVNNEEFNLMRGDKIIIPGEIKHSATVGEKGCEFFWSEKMTT